jgi:cell division protein FtsA
MAKGNILTGLDIGTGNIKILVAQRKKRTSELEVLGLVQVPSAGLRRGVVINPEETSRTIHLALGEIQNLTNRRADSAYVNIGGNHIFTISSKGVVAVSRADQKISAEDIERVVQAAQAFSLPSNKEIIDVVPKEFVVDGEKGIKEPLGLQGIRLEAEILALAGFSPYIKNLTSAVMNSGLQIDDLTVSPIAAARSVLKPKQKELGVCLLDIGAGTTNMAVFEESDLIHVAIFPVGSGHITNDIAIGLKTDLDTAEKIKLDFGACPSRERKRKGKMSHSKKKEKIEQAEGEELSFSQKMLNEIIEARVAEIFELANKELKKISRQGKLPAGIVLTGGGAKLPRIVEFTKKELKLPCHIGYPQEILGLEEDPSLAVVSGLILRGIDSEGEKGFSSFGGGIGSKIGRIFRIFIP